MKSRLILATICTFFMSASICFGYKATFHPRISVQGEHTDNLLLSENADLKEDDIITTISPGFTAELVGKKADAQIIYDASYASYDQFDEFNGWRHKANFFGKYKIAKNTRLKVRDNFLYTEDPLTSENIAEIRTEDPEIPIDSTNRKSRRIYTENLAKVSLSHEFGEDHSFKMSYTYGLLNNDDPAFEDKRRHTPSVGLLYWFGPKWGFSVDGSYTRGEFDVSDNIDKFDGSVSVLKRFGKHFIGFIQYSQSVVNHKGETEDDTTYVPSVGFKYDIEKDISLFANAGYFYNDYEFRESQSDFGGSLRLIKLFEHGKLNLAAIGGYDHSFFGAENLGFEVFYEGSASLTHRLAKHLSGYIFGSYRQSEYSDLNRKDRGPIIGTGVTWQVLEWMYLGINYRYRSIDSTIDANDYDENRLNVRILLTPSHPYRTGRY